MQDTYDRPTRLHVNLHPPGPQPQQVPRRPTQAQAHLDSRGLRLGSGPRVRVRGRIKL